MFQSIFQPRSLPIKYHLKVSAELILRLLYSFQNYQLKGGLIKRNCDFAVTLNRFNIRDWINQKSHLCKQYKHMDTVTILLGNLNVIVE